MSRYEIHYTEKDGTPVPIDERFCNKAKAARVARLLRKGNAFADSEWIFVFDTKTEMDVLQLRAPAAE